MDFLSGAPPGRSAESFTWRSAAHRNLYHNAATVIVLVIVVATVIALALAMVMVIVIVR